MKHICKISLVISCLLAPLTSTVNAADSRINKLAKQLDKFKVSGYINLTATQTEDEGVIFDSGADSIDTASETYGGVQFDFKATDKLSATVLTRFFAKSRQYDDRFGVDLAYMTYKLSGQTKLRGGILRVPLYKDSDYIDVRASLLWLRAPELSYSNDKVQRHTGVDVIHDIYLGDGTLQLQAFYGQNEDPYAKNGCECDTTFVIDDLMGLHATYTIDDHLYKLGVTTRTQPGSTEDFLYTDTSIKIVDHKDGTQTVSENVRYKLSAEGFLAGKRQTFYTAGYGYDDGQWKVDAEVLIQAQEAGTPDSGKFFTSVGYRFGALTPYITAQTSDSIDNNKRYLNAPHNTYVFPDDTKKSFYGTKEIKRRIYSIGARYDISPNLTLKAQIDKADDERLLVKGQIREKSNTLYSIGLQASF